MRALGLIFSVLILFGVAWFSLYKIDENTAVEKAPGKDSPVLTAEANRSTPSQIENAATLQKEASHYIEEITQRKEPVKIDKADGFISADQAIELLQDKTYETVTLAELSNDKSLQKDSAITIVRKTREIEPMTAAEILAASGGDLDEVISVLQSNQVIETRIGEIIKNQDHDAQFDVVREKENLEVTTVNQLAVEDINPDEEIRIIRKPYTLPTTSVGELLMDNPSSDEKYIFYVRNVGEDDAQGIWGIVHNGLVKNFASGIAIRRGENIERYQISIPVDADEMIDESKSSFLGQIIQRKSLESHVYNFREGKMGRNPDLIHPGQQIVIIGFSTEELIAIYQHFVERANS